MIVEFSLSISHFGMFLAGSLRKIQVLSDFTLQMAFQLLSVHTAALPLQLKFQPILLLTVHINYCHLCSADISTAFITF